MITDCVEAFSALLVLYPTLTLEVRQECPVCGSQTEKKMRDIVSVVLISEEKLLFKTKQKRMEVEVLDVEAYCSAIVDADENHVKVKERFPERCNQENCYSKLEMAEILGCVMYQSDDVEFKQQYISNSCTGFYRQYENWRFPIKGVNGTIWPLFCSKKQCIKCGIPYDVTKQKPYCPSCFDSLLSSSHNKSKFQQFPITKGLKERRSRFEFVKLLPPFSKENNYCSICSQSENYKPVFYYGYRAICSECVFKN